MSSRAATVSSHAATMSSRAAAMSSRAATMSSRVVPLSERGVVALRHVVPHHALAVGLYIVNESEILRIYLLSDHW